VFTHAHDIITWQNKALSTQALVASLAVAALGNLFSFNQLLILATLVAFSVPIAYQKNQALVDEQIAKVKPLLNTVLGSIPSASSQKKKE